MVPASSSTTDKKKQTVPVEACFGAARASFRIAAQSAQFHLTGAFLTAGEALRSAAENLTAAGEVVEMKPVVEKAVDVAVAEKVVAVAAKAVEKKVVVAETQTEPLKKVVAAETQTPAPVEKEVAETQTEEKEVEEKVEAEVQTPTTETEACETQTETTVDDEEDVALGGSGKRLSTTSSSSVSEISVKSICLHHYSRAHSMYPITPVTIFVSTPCTDKIVSATCPRRRCVHCEFL